ncbi:hypothetical protein N826_37060 [Skermanella aerolata KACC 11604]|nr:hypothetical protein N826_37060 [Skermanella aerolata KACC 11604]
MKLSATPLADEKEPVASQGGVEATNGDLLELRADLRPEEE